MQVEVFMHLKVAFVFEAHYEKSDSLTNGVFFGESNFAFCRKLRLLGSNLVSLDQFYTVK